MFNIGQYQKLIVSSVKSSGFYLKVPDTDLDVDILLPGSQAPEGTQVGDLLDVFVYRDSEDRLITTTRTPKITLGRLALLKVVRISEIGAFLEWGLERDLFLPFAEQLRPVKAGEKLLVRMYLDKTERLCATMKTQKDLKQQAPFAVGETHEATVYRVNEEIGLFVAVEDLYEGLVLKQDIFGHPRVGDRLQLHVTKVTEEGKLQMAFHKPIPMQMGEDAERILKALEAHDGHLPFGDSSPPDEIRKTFGMSKKAFKRAIGRLYKEKRIVLGDDGIRLK